MINMHENVKLNGLNSRWMNDCFIYEYFLFSKSSSFWLKDFQ